VKNPCILIAGASGFVGRALLDRLLSDFPEASLVALSRSAKQSTHPRLSWQQCDLFSEESISKALPAKVDIVYYLVHSMEPTAQLDQGSFADYDLIMADNFARACRAKGVQHLVYLGGLIPNRGDLSLHLQSRLEVETVFVEHQIPHTFFRAGLIIGEMGSSFQILIKLVKRLHVMICPAWTQTLTSPVDLPAVVGALVTAVKSPQHLGHTYDLASCRPLTYIDMMRLTAQHLGLKRYFVRVPFFSPTLSRLWLSLITNTSRYLVYPLIESLEHPMVARNSHSFYPDSQSRGYRDLLKGISTHVISKPFRFRMRVPGRTVRSVQRIPVTGLNAASVAERYFAWLPAITQNLISVKQGDRLIQLLLFKRVILIELQKVATFSESDRVTYAIPKGLLVSPSPLARLEFRLLLQRKFVVVAIHDYAPALPWFIYRYTQAQAHRAVMWAFRYYLYRSTASIKPLREKEQRGQN
jgi:uncharacterized protein YbjT (DUF2867 family)